VIYKKKKEYKKNEIQVLDGMEATGVITTETCRTNGKEAQEGNKPIH